MSAPEPVVDLELIAAFIDGRLTPAERERALQYFAHSDAAFEVLYEPTNVHAHHWQAGDFVVWDNLMFQHGRPANPNSVRRSLRRIAMNTVTTTELIAGTGFDPEVRARRASARGSAAL